MGINGLREGVSRGDVEVVVEVDDVRPVAVAIGLLIVVHGHSELIHVRLGLVVRGIGAEVGQVDIVEVLH